jgi:uncharacterized protein (TIGR02996 family)
MTEIGQLLDQVRASPEDDHPRLVLADCYEERGELDRAMFIRYGCEAARLPRWERRAIEAAWEAEALLAAHGRRWRAELPVLDGVTWLEFERGFPSLVRVRDVATLYRHDAAIDELVTVTGVELTRLDEAGVPYLPKSVPWLHTLRLLGTTEHASHRQRSLLGAIRVLELRGVREFLDLDWLSVRRDGAPLEELRIDGDHTVGAHLVRALVQEPQLSELRRLGLGTSFVDYDSGYFDDPTLRDNGAELLAAAELPALVALDLDRQRIGNAGVAALLHHLPQLRELALRAAELDDVGVFTAAAGAPLLRLVLAEIPLGDARLAQLLAGPRLAELEVLDLDTCEIGPGGIEALTRAPCWHTLRVLELGRNPLGSAGLAVLAAAPPPRQLHTLGLADVDADGLGQALAIPWLSRLLALDLSRTPVSIESAHELAAATSEGMRSLRLARCRIDTRRAAALAPACGNLWRLGLASNPLGDTGLLQIIKHAPELTKLDVRRCQLAGSLGRLDRLGALRRLHALALGGNEITRDALIGVIRAPWIDQLDVLRLDNLAVDSAVLHALAETPAIAGLRTLDLREHDEADEAALVALARSSFAAEIPDLRVQATPWRFPESRELLAARFGTGWNICYPSDEEDGAIDTDEE